MRCVSGKTSYVDQAQAEEALIQNHIRNNHRTGSGPINVYQCSDCNDWHFTSQGPISRILIDPGVIERIKKESRAYEFENGLK